MKNYKFRTRNQAHNMRKQVWICLSCRMWHEKKPTTFCCNQMDPQYFPSTAEAKRYMELLMLQDHDLISKLKPQPVYPIKVNGVHICNYRGDSTYYTAEGNKVVEDVKPKGFEKNGLATDVFKFKRKCVAALYGIDITIVER